jgi:hypothetical protein
LDTNVFYNLGSGVLDVASFVQAGDTLYYSPVTVLELAGKWSDTRHVQRKAAAQAILDSGAVELPDPEAFLTERFGYPLADPVSSYHDAVVAMANSTSMAELVAGIQDHTAGVSRRVSVTTANSWRVSVEGKWVSDMLALQKQLVPKFATWYDPDPTKRTGGVPKLTGAKKSAFLGDTRSAEWLQALLVACQNRALMGAKRGPHLMPTAETVARLSKAIEEVAAYCGIYTQYLIRLMTEGALPEHNDSGDLELLLYSVDDDHLVVTSEKKWKTLATKANCPQRVLLV